MTKAHAARPGRLDRVLTGMNSSLFRHACTAFALLTAAVTLGAGPAVAQDTSPAPTASASPAASPVAPGPPPPSLDASPSRVTSGRPATISVGGASGRVDLFAANRGSDQFFLIRSGEATGGSITFTIYPDRHKVVYAQASDDSGNLRNSNGVTVLVTAAVTIQARRLAPRDYEFFGTVRPVSAGLTVNLYRVDSRSGTTVLTARASTRADGAYTVRRRFTGSGTFGFFTRTAASDAADPGASSTRQTAVH